MLNVFNHFGLFCTTQFVWDKVMCEKKVFKCIVYWLFFSQDILSQEFIVCFHSSWRILGTAWPMSTCCWATLWPSCTVSLWCSTCVKRQPPRPTLGRPRLPLLLNNDNNVIFGNGKSFTYIVFTKYIPLFDFLYVRMILVCDIPIMLSNYLIVDAGCVCLARFLVFMKI